MKTGEEICRDAGIDFSQGAVDASQFVARKLPLVVACNMCGMTMAFPSCLVCDEGFCWCTDCGAYANPGNLFCAGYTVCADLKEAARELGAGEAEIAAIKRLQNGEALRVDIDRLRPLALEAKLPWDELFPADG